MFLAGGSWKTVVALVGGLEAASIRLAPAQQIGEAPTCRTCVVTLTDVVKLVPSPNAGFGPLVEIAARRDGVFYVASSTFPGEIHVFNSAGRFESSIGRRGSGPGEFVGSVLLAVDGANVLHIVQRSPARHSLVDTSSKILGTRALQATRVFDFLPTRSGDLFVSSPLLSESRVVPLHLLNASDGLTKSSFGADSVEKDLYATIRYLTIDEGGAIWSVPGRKLTIEQWSSNGMLQKKYSGERDWLSKQPIPTRLDVNRERPPGQISGISAGPSGELFVFAMVPDVNWKPSSGVEQPQMDKVWDTLVEVLDARTGLFLSRTRFDRVLLPFQNDLAYTVLEDEVGERYIQIHRVSLRRP